METRYEVREGETMNIILGGYILGMDSERQQLPTITDPNYDSVKEALLSLKKSNGVIGLRLQPEPESGPYELMMYSDSGQFLIMLNEYDDDGDSNVRTVNQSISDKELIPIMGDFYSANTITRDFEFVCSIFEDFINTGNVSEQLMC